MRILDAGGGNGLDSIPFAKQGHQVDIVDSSKEMLANARDRAIQENIQEHITTHLDDIKDISALFPNLQFDLILCHNVLPYVEDVPGLFDNFSTLLKPGGIVSIISINRYSTPYHSALLGNNLEEALAHLDTRSSKAKIFNAVMTNYSAEEIKEQLEKPGLVPEADLAFSVSVITEGE